MDFGTCNDLCSSGEKEKGYSRSLQDCSVEPERALFCTILCINSTLSDLFIVITRRELLSVWRPLWWERWLWRLACGSSCPSWPASCQRL